jgi:hypothetical protein
MAPLALLTKLFGRKAAAVIMVVITDVAITVGIAIATKLLAMANDKLENVNKQRNYRNTNAEDDYVTVRTSLDSCRSGIKRKGTKIP